jgi:hypothetical protein
MTRSSSLEDRAERLLEHVESDPRFQIVSQHKRENCQRTMATVASESPRNKRSAETKAAHATPATGHSEQHKADAPVPGARLKYRFAEFFARRPMSQFGVKQFLTLARQFNCVEGDDTFRL